MERCRKAKQVAPQARRREGRAWERIAEAGAGGEGRQRVRESQGLARGRGEPRRRCGGKPRASPSGPQRLRNWRTASAPSSSVRYSRRRSVRRFSACRTASRVMP